MRVVQKNLMQTHRMCEGIDESICHKFSLDSDLDEQNWDLFRTRANISAEMAPENVLQNLNLNESPSNAGAWLLAKEFANFTAVLWFVNDH